MKVRAKGRNLLRPPYKAFVRRRRLEGAEAQSMASQGRPLTTDELELVTKRYPA
jgi:hypothetical protein